MSPDLRHATVFVKPLLGADEEEVLKALRTARPLPAGRGRAAGEHQICRQPQVPADESFDEGSHIDSCCASPKVAQDLERRR